jgi:hypothetical protein
VRLAGVVPLAGVTASQGAEDVKLAVKGTVATGLLVNVMVWVTVAPPDVAPGMKIVLGFMEREFCALRAVAAANRNSGTARVEM